MPKVTVYIRNEDYEKWKSIGAKTTFIHNCLKKLEEGGIDSIGMLVDDRVSVVELGGTEGIVRLGSTDATKIIKTPNQAKAVVEKLKPKAAKLCKHGFPLGECLDKKSDRSCKL